MSAVATVTDGAKEFDRWQVTRSHRVVKGLGSQVK
jgi:hypothetical protein